MATIVGVYRARDLFRVPGLLSLARLPLAAAFPFVVGQPGPALAVLVAAGLSDVLDGWFARRYGQVTPTGAALDPVTDKIFVLTVAVTLVVRGFLSPADVLLLSTREVGELPLVIWLALSHRARQLRAESTSANVPGKLATAFQFAAATAALIGWSHVYGMVIVTAAAGVVAAVVYWVRAVVDVRAAAAAQSARR
jgi:CDP-diacylglycerol--glycerol-3-phosphate 3-phosphatidyltransferase/cardiolipin synthase